MFLIVECMAHSQQTYHVSNQHFSFMQFSICSLCSALVLCISTPDYIIITQILIKESMSYIFTRFPKSFTLPSQLFNGFAVKLKMM